MSNTKAKSKHTNKTEAKSEQIKAIKKRLNEALDAEGLNIYQLTEAINKSDSEINVNYNTVRKAFDNTTTALDITVFIAVSRYLHLDTAVLLSEPETKYETLKSVPDTISSGQFSVLDDKNYLGKYYGYFYSQNPKSNSIIHFELETKDTQNGFRSTLQYHGKVNLVDGSVADSQRTLYGTPILHALRSNVYINFANDLGDFFFFYFSRQWFTSNSLYFRKGVVLSASTIGDKPPIVQSFVMFARELSEEKEKFIPGLLGTASPSFSIRKEDAEALCASEPVVADFFNDFGYILEHQAKSIYSINENQILASTDRQTMDINKVFQAICLLKEKALEPNRICYEDNNDMAGFTKRFLQKA